MLFLRKNIGRGKGDAVLPEHEFRWFRSAYDRIKITFNLTKDGLFFTDADEVRNRVLKQTKITGRDGFEFSGSTPLNANTSSSSSKPTSGPVFGNIPPVSGNIPSGGGSSSWEKVAKSILSIIYQNLFL